MVRQKIKGTKVRRSLTPEEEPNFYLPDWEKRLRNAEKSFSSGPSSSQNSKEDRQQKRRPSVSKSAPQEKTTPKKSIRPTKKNPLKDKPESLVDMIRDAQAPVAPPTGPPQVIHTMSVLPPEDVQGGDLLFFEGLPFRYLDHMEEVPPVLSQPGSLVAGPRATNTLPRPYSYPDKDNLLRSINSIVINTPI